MHFQYNKALVFTSILLIAGKALKAIDPSKSLEREIVRRSKAADMKAWLNTNIKPCDNFYKFACNQWSRIHPAEVRNVPRTNNFEEVSTSLQRRINQLLTKPERGSEFEEKLREFYKSCLETKVHKEEYLKALQKLYGAYGEFSFVKATGVQVEKETFTPAPKFNWWSLIANLQMTYGKSILFAFDVVADTKNRNKTMLYIGPSNLLINEPYMKGTLMGYLTTIFGVEQMLAEKVATSILDFEIALLEGSSELALNTTQLPQEVFVFDEQYLANVLQVMDIYDPIVVQDYILWVLLEEYLLDFSIQNWSEFCGEKTKKYFGKFINNLVYKTFRSEQYEEELFTLWREIKDVFRESLNGTQYVWMSAEVREEALHKLEAMTLSITSYEEEDFPAFFGGLQITNHTYVANVEKILRKIENLRPNKMTKQPASIDATEEMSFTPVYHHFENSITMPVALLQPFWLWSPLYPQAIKYATLGFLLAHEMIHGFDDKGRLYDAHGQLKNWWDASSSLEFERRRTCFQRQYYRYLYDDDRYDKEMPQAENIADNVAIKFSFVAYEKWWQKSKKLQFEEKAAGEDFSNLDYNMWQLFFISFSQLWCSDTHPKFRHMQDIHAPSEYRVIGALSNFEKFSEIFQCKLGTTMHPVVRCEVY
ncbi:neprilysin-4-like [Stomoxys calcitrans]|uniref:Peptidase M13 C-terminal domain-containing protein n=1 Tax=Stomoxys calcitrans TaxID=35570 RepID=A0A1I8PXE6_STOCA|nr:neprilysin-4-like [Stomoxys calcitrans]